MQCKCEGSATMRWQLASVREHNSQSSSNFYLKNLQTHKQMGYNAMAMSLCLHYSALRSSRYRQMSTSTFWENLLNVCCQDAVVGKLLNYTVLDIYIRKWFNAEVLSLLERDASIIFMFRAVSCKIVKKYLKNIRWRLWRCSLAKFSRNIWKNIRWRLSCTL